MSVVFSDNFNRADTTNLGAEWNEVDGNSEIISNQLSQPVGANAGRTFTTTTAHAAIADMKVSIKHISGDRAECGVVARATGSGDFYAFAIRSGGGNSQLYRFNGGTKTQLDVDSATFTYVSGAPIELQVTGTGATVTVQAWYNSVQMFNYADTDASRITGAGQAGVYNWGLGTATFDDFSVDDLQSAATQATPGSMMAYSFGRRRML